MDSRNKRRARRAGALTGVAAVWFSFSVSPAAHAACERVVGRIDGIEVEGERRETVGLNQLSIERDGRPQPAASGMPVCPGDRLATGPGTVAVLRLGETFEKEHLVTLYPNSNAEISDEKSLFLRFGRLFADLQGLFDVGTRFARLGARGTEFEVEVTEEGVELVQLSGAVEFVPIEPTGARPTLERPSAGLSAAWSAGFLQKKSPKESGRAGYKALTVDRLTRVSFQPARSPAPRVLGADEKLVRRVIKDHSGAVIQTRPAAPSRSLIPAYSSAEERARAFLEARFATIWNPEERKPFEELGGVYADWGEATRAVRSYAEAGKIQRSESDWALYYNHLGNAYRLAGETTRALELYERALASDRSLSFPYNGLGDVYKDLAAAALDRREPEKARAYLERARRYYQQSLDPNLWGKEGGRNRAVPLYNLGETSLFLTELSVGDSEKSLEEAEDYFARALGEARGYPFALVGIGRVLAARAGLYESRGEKGQARQSRSKAAELLLRVADQHPTFAVAQLRLGEVLEQQGNTKEALERFSRATQLDPLYPPAYFRLARTLERVGQRAQARLYYQAFLQVESPLFLQGERGKTARESIGSVEPEPPRPQTKVPDVIGDRADEAIQKIRRKKLVEQVQERAECKSFGKVVAQEPRKDTRVPEGSTVIILVAGPGSDAATVPQVVGLDQASAEQRIREQGLKVDDIRRRETEGGTPGTVLSQKPDPGTRAARGCPVDLTVAVPVPLVEVPRFVGMTEAQARRYLPSGLGGLGAELRLGNVIYQESRAVAGTVIAQDPAPGALVRPGTAVNLVVARQAAPPTPETMVVVPEVRQDTLNDAISKLRRVGLNFETRGETSCEYGVYVYEQTPSAGTLVPQGTKVILSVRCRIG